MLVKTLLNDLLQGARLDQTAARTVFATLFDGDLLPAQITAILTIFAMRGADSAEIAGAVEALRARMIAVPTALPVIDCCGTGGDMSGTYNISTAVSFITAACDVPMAKHGNRSASSQCGAADVLEACGVRIDLSASQLAQALEHCNIAFLFAPNHHPALRQVATLRQELGFRTIFNLLGPLLNPCRPQRQLIGVYDVRLLELMAQAAQACGLSKAWIIHGAGGMDEIALHGDSFICALDDGAISAVRTVTPTDFGLAYVNPAQLQGGKAEQNAAALLDLLNGAPSPYRDTVLANAACALAVAYDDNAPDLKLLTAKAANAVDSGAARHVFERYRAFSNGGTAA